MATYIPFLRVSTTAQETARQLADIAAYAGELGWQLTKPIMEKISGTTANKDRPGLNALLKKVRAGDTVIVTEISRLGRDTHQVLTFLMELKDRHVGLFVLNLRQATLRADGSTDEMVQTLLTIWAEMGRQENVLTRERIKSGIKEKLATGHQWGRRPGQGKPDAKLLKDHAQVVKLLESGLSGRQVARAANVCRDTVDKVRKLLPTAPQKAPVSPG